MKIAAIQMDLAWENPSENFRRAEEQIAQSAQLGARLVVLPEMFATGFCMASDRAVLPSASIRSFLAETAKRYSLWLLGGYAEPGLKKPRNAASAFDPMGNERARYQKIHPFSLAREDEFFEAGDQLTRVTIEGIRVSFFICYDLRFPELFRAVADGTDLVCVLANWPAPRRHAWRTLLTARAIENQNYVLGVNRIGAGDGQAYCGDSSITDPQGQTLIEANATCGPLVADISAEEVAEVRRRFSFLQDRRLHIYSKFNQAE